MESDTLKKIEKELEGVNPYSDDEMPDEISTMEEFDRCLATMLNDLKENKI